VASSGEPRAIFGRDFFVGCDRSLGSATDQVVVVVGNNETQPGAGGVCGWGFPGAKPNPRERSFSSLRVGLQEVLNLGRDAVMITLVDRRSGRTAVLASLRAAFEVAPSEILGCRTGIQ